MIPRSGLLRERLRATLTEAYGVGLMSDATFAGRLDVLVSETLIEPERLIGDLTLRPPAARRRRRLRRPRGLPIVGLDWSGASATLLLGRGPACDITFTDPTVSRRHAALSLRDGHWVIADLDSRNGTWVNGDRVGRCELRAGDLVAAGEQRFWID